MRLTARGDRVLSAGGVLSVNGHVPAHLVGTYAGSACPLDDDYLVYQRCDGISCRLERLHLPTFIPSVIDYQGVNTLRAGGGQWGALLVGSGLRTSGAYRSDIAGLWDVSPDGHVLICEQYQLGTGIVWIRKDGSVLKVIGAAETGPIATAAGSGPCVRALSEARVAWVDESGRVHVSGIPHFLPRPASEPIAWVVPVDMDGDVWLLELSHRLTLRPADSLEGIVVAPAPPTFGPDVVALSETVARVAWSRTVGEGPNDGEYRDLDIDAEEMVDLSQPARPAPSVEPYHRMVPHFAYFTLDADRGYGDHFEEILHACWCATASDVAKANEQQAWIICGPEHAAMARKLAMVMISNDYAGAPPLETQIPAAVAICRERACGLIVLDDGRWDSFPANLPSGAFLGFKVFRDPGQTISAWMQRAFETTVRVQTQGFRSVWVVGADDRNRTLTDAEIEETLQTVTELLAELGGPTRDIADDAVAIIGAFSYARRELRPELPPTGGGIVHPRAWRWVRASAAASDPVEWSAYRLPVASAPSPIPPAKPFTQGVAMQWIVSLIGANGLRARVDPNAPVGSLVPCDRSQIGGHEKFLMRKEAKGFTFRAIDASKTAAPASAEEVILSSPDRLGEVQTRPGNKRFADEEWSVVQLPKDPDGKERVAAYVGHIKDGIAFAPTLFTVEVLEKVA